MKDGSGYIDNGATQTDVVYQGFSDGVGSDFISVRRDGRSMSLKHYVQQSPSGFSWGYGGSGPAEAARCILIDFIGLEPKWSLHNDKHGSANDRASFPEIDSGTYQAFKWAFITTLPQGKAWEITGAQIAEWLKSNPPLLVCSQCRSILPDNETGICEHCKHTPKPECDE